MKSMATSKIKANINVYTNVDATKVGSNWTGGTIRAHRVGYVVTLKLDGAVLSAASARVQIATIPVGYRPVTEVYLRAQDNREFIIASDGSLKMSAQSAGTLWGAVTYLCLR